MAHRLEWDDSSPGRFRSGMFSGSVTRLIIIACCVMFGLTLVFQRFSEDGLGARNRLLEWLELRVDNAWMVFPLITYSLLHDLGSLLHLAMNMLLLWFLGGMVEAEIGKRRFCILYIGSVLVGAVAFLIDAAIAGRNSGVIGASGGALGVLLYAACRNPNLPMIFIIIPMRLKTLAILYVAFDLYPVLMRIDSLVAHWCHLGGAAYGYLYFKFPFDPLASLDVLRSRWTRFETDRRLSDERAEEAEMDRILKKISETGLPSLSAKEREFIERRSRHLRRGRPQDR